MLSRQSSRRVQWNNFQVGFHQMTVAGWTIFRCFRPHVKIACSTELGLKPIQAAHLGIASCDRQSCKQKFSSIRYVQGRLAVASRPSPLSSIFQSRRTSLGVFNQSLKDLHVEKTGIVRQRSRPICSRLAFCLALEIITIGSHPNARALMMRRASRQCCSWSARLR